MAFAATRPAATAATPDPFAAAAAHHTPGDDESDQACADSPTANNLISAPPKAGALGYCRHRLFGRGKFVQHIPPDKYRVNFTGFGLKVIMADYLVMEED